MAHFIGGRSCFPKFVRIWAKHLPCWRWEICIYASFGTWRDGFGRLIWGIDDFDEAYPLPYANDLVRLAVSAILDASEGEIKVGLGNVIDVILDGYRACLREGGKPFVLEEKHKWLRKIALGCLDIPADFWKKMDALPAARRDVPADARKAISALLPAPDS